jgi:hypothetical protein
MSINSKVKAVSNNAVLNVFPMDVFAPEQPSYIDVTPDGQIQLEIREWGQRGSGFRGPGRRDEAFA